MCNSIKSIGIIGYGKFGRFINEIISKHSADIDVRIFRRQDPQEILKQVTESDLIILAVPISAIESTVKNISKLVRSESAVMDVCSVKTYPKKILSQYLNNNPIICSHPMFGPGTYAHRNRNGQQDFIGLKIVIENVQGDGTHYKVICNFCQKLGMDVVELNADEHDRLAAHFQFLTLATATLLKPLELRHTLINTESAEALIKVLDMISVDQQLIKDMYNYNPYCTKEFYELKQSFLKLENLLTEVVKT